GLTAAFQSLYDIVKLPLVHSHLVQQLNIEYPKGVLLYGPPGVGKTMLVTTVAKYCSADLFTINGSDVFGSHLGESEEHIRNKFNEALGVARSQANRRACILFIDEIDAIAPNRNESSQSDSRMVATLLTLMDGMKSHSDRLIVLAATNRPNAIDPALRRPGRFDREIAFEAPNESARYDILKSMAKGIGSVDADVDFKALAISTNGYVGADLAALSREAVVRCLESGSGRWYKKCGISIYVSNADFLYALSITTPSTTRGYGVGVPAGLTWDSVGGLEDVKLKLRQCVEWPIIHRETFRRLGLKPPRGVLLYGPPGCSKTTLVKIIASTSNATFLSINGASLYSPFVGDSEQSVRSLFHRARISAPSVIFLDEIDAIVGNRDLSGGGGGGGSRDATQESVLSTLLNEMDGIEAAKDVLVVGATNRPDMIDAALMRPGRFDKVVYVPPPDQTARREIFNLYTKGMPLSTSEGIDFESLADRTERYTGADLESVCREAAFSALRENKEAENFVEGRHFEDALKSVKPSLSEDMLRQY
ncbi:P-loop containing nucleoside triphosphate hydrolase protein, partial [Obelidium mucronatum]